MKEFPIFTSRITLHMHSSLMLPSNVTLNTLSYTTKALLITLFLCPPNVWKAFLPAPAEFSLSCDDGGQDPNELMPGRKGALL